MNQPIKYHYPKPITFTLIGNPDVDDGAPAKCAVDPTMIAFVVRGRSAWHKESADPTAHEFHPRKSCTVIWLKNQGTISVMDEVEIVISKWQEALV